VFGFRAPGANTDGGVQDGPYWDALAAFAADDTYYRVPDTANLVCSPIIAEAANAKTQEQAAKKLDTPEEPATWYFTLTETTVTASPDEKSATIGRVGKVALPVFSAHPPQEGDAPSKPTHLQVLLPSGKTGWIPFAAARPMVSNRLCYSKAAGGEWKIVVYDQNEE
jgi:hypothetical protein